MNTTMAAIARMLRSYRTIAVVGLSADTSRDSHQVALYMQSHGYRVVGVNPRYAGQQLLGETCHATLADIAFAVDMVDVFRPTQDVLPFAAQAIAIGARCFWQQLGICNLEADALVRAAGLDAVYNRCLKIDHGQLMKAQTP